MIRFTQEETDHLLQFIGYGNLRAPVWFLGMEERGLGTERLRQRLNFSPVEDLDRAQRLLGIRQHHMPPVRLEAHWSTMAKIMLMLTHLAPTPSNLRVYQAAQLGRTGGDTLLVQFWPLPTPNMIEWPYAGMFEQFHTRDDYRRHVKPLRVELLRNLIATEKPPVVICYGKDDWLYYKQIFEWSEWQVMENFEYTLCDDTRVFLTPHLLPYLMSDDRISQLSHLIRKTTNRARWTVNGRGH